MCIRDRLDGYFNGLASQNYLGSYIYEVWGQHTFTQGTWTSDFEKSSIKLNDSLDDKVYFSGETYNTHGITPNRGFYIIRGSVQSAILSDYDVVEQNFGAVSFQVGTGGGGNFFISTSLQAQNFLGTGRTLGVGINKSRFQESLNFQYVDPYFTPDGVSRGMNLFAQKIESPFNVSSFNTSSYGGSVSFSYPISEVEVLGFDLGFTHTELSAGLGSVQEIIASPVLFEGIDKYIVTPANGNAFNGPVVDSVLGNVGNLRDNQLGRSSELSLIHI